MLLGSTSTSAQVQSKNISPSRPAYPQERKALYDQVSRDATSPTYKRNIAPRHDGTAPTSSLGVRGGTKDKQEMSFYLLSESEVVPPASIVPEKMNVKAQQQDVLHTMDGMLDEGKAMSHEMERVSRLFEILSARSDIDHPICVECTELLVDGLQKRLEAATRERDAYVGFLKQVQAEIPTEEELEETKAALKRAQGKEAAALEELMKLEAEKAAVDEEIAGLE